MPDVSDSSTVSFRMLTPTGKSSPYLEKYMDIKNVTIAATFSG
jgi:hypothetical protein